MDSEKSLTREYLEALLIAVIFATFARTWIVQAFKIPSGSMEQNLLIGDHILVNKCVYGPPAPGPAVVSAPSARTWIVQAFKIPSGSMEQNLLIGDHILVNKFVYGPTATGLERALLPVREVRRGDIVVFKYPKDASRDFIKRCMALPGATTASAGKGISSDGRS